METRREPRWLWWAVLVAVTALAGFLQYHAVTTTIVDTPITADATEYYLSAYNLRHHGVYTISAERLADAGAPLTPDAIRYPGLPLVEALFMGQWPDHAAIVRDVQVVNTIAGAAATALLFVAASAALPFWAATLSALLTSLSPHLISFTVYLLTEPISALLVTAILAAMALPPERLRYVCAGALVGALTLFRPPFLPFAALLPLTAPSKRRLALITAVAAAGIVVAPWFIRNAISVPDVPGTPSLAAIGLISGAYPGYLLNGDPSTFPYPFVYDQSSNAAVTSVGAAVREIANRFAADPLGMAAWYCCEKIGFFWQWDNIDGAGDVFIYPVSASPFLQGPMALLHNLMARLHWLMVLLGLIGCILAWHPLTGRLFSNRALIVLRTACLLLAFGTLIHVPFYMSTRYAVPLYPALYVMALVPFAVLQKTWAKRFAPALGD